MEISVKKYRIKIKLYGFQKDKRNSFFFLIYNVPEVKYTVLFLIYNVPEVKYTVQFTVINSNLKRQK